MKSLNLYIGILLEKIISLSIFNQLFNFEANKRKKGYSTETFLWITACIRQAEI
jgi:hypothetical protein